MFTIKWIKLTLVLFFLLVLAACGGSTEDTQNYIGVLASESSMGYEYTVTKEIDSFQWEVGYKDDVVTVEENEQNAKLLDLFREQVEENRFAVFQLGLFALYLVVILTLLGLLIWRKLKVYRKYSILLSSIALVVVGYLIYKNILQLNLTLNDLEYLFAVIKSNR